MRSLRRSFALGIALISTTMALGQAEPATSGPSTQPASTPATQRSIPIEPATQSQPAPTPATKPAAKPAAKSEAKPAAKPASRAATKPTTKPAQKPATPKPAAKVDGKAVLKKLVGTFDVTSKVRGAPDSPWIELKGEEIGQLILNDRYIQSVSTLKIGDETHFYLTLTGFDPETQSFTFSSMGDDYDQMLLGTGTANPEGTRLELKTNDGKTRFVINFDDKGYNVRLFAKDEQGKEFLAGEDRYQRRAK